MDWSLTAKPSHAQEDCPQGPDPAVFPTAGLYPYFSTPTPTLQSRAHLEWPQERGQGAKIVILQHRALKPL